MLRFLPSVALGILIAASTNHAVVGCDDPKPAPSIQVDSTIYVVKKGFIIADTLEDMNRALMYEAQGDKRAFDRLVSKNVVSRVKGEIPLKVYKQGCANPECSVIEVRPVGIDSVGYVQSTALEPIAPPVP